MAKSSNKLPSYRLHKRSGQAIVTIGSRDFYLGEYGTKDSRTKYNRLVGEYVASGRSPVFGVEPSELTIVELLASYMGYARQYYGTGRTSEYVRMRPIVKVMRKLYGSTKAVEFGSLQFKTCRQAMIDKGDSRQYINHQARRILRVFRWATSEGLVPVSVYQTLKTVDPLRAGRTGARETEPVRPVSQETVDATLPHCTQVVGDMIRFQLLVGCRPAEVCAITPGMVDRSADVWLIRLEKHKTAHRGRQRTIYVGPTAQQILAKYLFRNQDKHCFSPAESEAQRRAAIHASRVTPLNAGNSPGTNRVSNPKKKPSEKFDTQSYGRSIRGACKRAKITPWSPNKLRHAAATTIRREFGLDAASVMLGHSDLAITQVYAEADTEKALLVARKIG